MRIQYQRIYYQKRITTLNDSIIIPKKALVIHLHFAQVHSPIIFYFFMCFKAFSRFTDENPAKKSLTK